MKYNLKTFLLAQHTPHMPAPRNPAGGSGTTNCVKAKAR